MLTAPNLKDEAWRYADPEALDGYQVPHTPAVECIDAEVCVIEILEPGATARVFDIKPGGHLRHLRLAPASLGGAAFAHGQINVAAGATYTSQFINFAPTYVRNELHVDLNGKNAHAELQGLYLLKNRGHSDTLTRVHHRVADTTSDEVYKGVLSDGARGVFQAQIRVAPDAQRIIGNQMHRAIVLSDQARVDVKPELEIFADDVQCSHGATVGDLDAQQLFYLGSRGIALSTARALLIEAFVADMLDALPVEHAAGVRSDVSGFLRDL